MRVVLTQPQPRVAVLAATLGLAGHEVVSLCFSSIHMRLDDPAVRRALARLDTADWVIPVSPSAVDVLVESGIDRATPLNASVGLIGPGSLEHWPAGLSIRRPVLPRTGRYDGTALVAEPEFAQISGCRVVLLQSSIRRPAWTDLLVQRGAEVEVICCYEVRRQTPSDDDVVELLGWLTESGSDKSERPVIVASSVALARECVSWMRKAVPAEYWLALNACEWLVQHPRIAEALYGVGIHRVRMIRAGESGLLEALELRP